MLFNGCPLTRIFISQYHTRENKLPAAWSQLCCDESFVELSIHVSLCQSVMTHYCIMLSVFLSNRHLHKFYFEESKLLLHYTKLFDGESIPVKHVIMGPDVRDNRERSPEMKWGRGWNELVEVFKNEQLRCNCHCLAPLVWWPEGCAHIYHLSAYYLSSIFGASRICRVRGTL